MPTVPLATYLLKRIHQLGITHVQGNQGLGLTPPTNKLGVPGDMNLRFLDFVEEAPEITWGNIPR
jgi:TPP-dependent 2-oxoacid decarboxylase